MPYTKGYRYKRVPGDNNAAIEKKQIQNPVYATTIALTSLDCEKNIVEFQQLTGNLTVTAEVTNPFACDELILIIPVDSSTRTVTFSTGLTTVGGATLALTTGTVGIIKFMFCSVTSTWIESGRAIN
jgi:hypothetical protein